MNSPHIKPRKDGREVKWVVAFPIANGYATPALNDNSTFVPVRVEVRVWPVSRKAYAVATGESRYHRGFPGSSNFNIYGCPQYPACPDWLKDLIFQAMSWNAWKDGNPHGNV